MTTKRSELLYWALFEKDLIEDPETGIERWKPGTPERVINSFKRWVAVNHLESLVAPEYCEKPKHFE